MSGLGKLIATGARRLAGALYRSAARLDRRPFPSPVSLNSPLLHWHGCTPVSAGTVGVSLRQGEDIFRFRMPTRSADALQRCLADLTSTQSEMSSGTPR